MNLYNCYNNLGIVKYAYFTDRENWGLDKVKQFA